MKIFNGMAASASTITHLKRELMHEVWLLLLNANFMHAYEHRIVIKCVDGIVCRIFPRFSHTLLITPKSKQVFIVVLYFVLTNFFLEYFLQRYDIWHNAHAHNVRFRSHKSVPSEHMWILKGTTINVSTLNNAEKG